MSIELIASGTTTVSSGDTSLGSTVTVSGGGAVYALEVDATALAVSESLEITASKRCRVSDTARVLYKRVVSSYPALPALRALPIVSAQDSNTVAFSARVVGAAASRSIPWAVKKLGSGVDVAASGAAVCTVGSAVTATTLTPPSGGGVYVLSVDTSVLAAGEALDVALSANLLTGGSSHTLESVLFTAGSSEVVRDSYPVPLSDAQTLVVSLKQIGGTARTVPWCLLRVG